MTQKIIKSLEKINNAILKISQLYVWKLPPILVFISLIWLSIYSVSQIISSEEILKELFSFYLATIGLTITLASVTFSYAKVFKQDDIREKIIHAGESFLHAAIAAILAILLAWLSDKLNSIFQNRNYYDFIKYIVMVIGSLSSIFLYIVAINLYSGLIDLEKFLFNRTKKNL